MEKVKSDFSEVGEIAVGKIRRRGTFGKWTKYGRRYCKSWEQDPDLKAWIRPVPYDPQKAQCLFCKRHLRAHHQDLVTHFKTAKHQKNESLVANILDLNSLENGNIMVVETYTGEDRGDPLDGIISEQALESSEDAEAERTQILVAILTVSDRCFKGDADDTSGPNLAAKVKELFNANVVAQQTVPDSITEIQKVMVNWCDDLKVDLLLSTGGTGFSPRDVTPEATRSLIDKIANGLSVAMTLGSLQKTSMGMLSRSVCGIRGNTLIINLPGSFNGSQDCLEIVSPVIGHAVDQLRNSRNRITRTHSEVANISSTSSQGSSTNPGNEIKTEHVSRVAYRARSSPYPMISVEYAQNIIKKENVLEGTEICKYKECNGRFLVNDVVSYISHPPFRASIKDGYAVIAADGAGKRKVLGEASAGSSLDSHTLVSGTCVRISTGAPVPSSADAVVQVEDTELYTETGDGVEELEVTIIKAPRVNQDIRAAGSDIGFGQTILERHQRLGPSEMGLLAAIGLTSISVFKRPTVSVLSTGSEIMEPGQTLRDGCIWDSNKTCILAMLDEHGYKTEDCGIAKDTYETVVSKFCHAFQKGSVVITTGGVSMGEKDLVKNVLEDHFKAKIHFGQVFVKPGKPTTFATCTYETKKKLIFALPGNPVSAVVTFNLFVLPALKYMSGDLDPSKNLVRVRLEHCIPLDPRPEYHRAVVTWHSNQSVPTACTTGNQISSRLLSMKLANAILVLPPKTIDQEAINEGEVVDAIMIARI